MTSTQDAAPADSFDEAVAAAEQQLTLVFGRVRQAWVEAAAQIHPDLQPLGYKLLSSIVRMGHTSAGQLAELYDTDKSVVSRQLKMLEEAGFVTSRVDPADGRARVLEPTPLAIERVTASAATRRERLRAVLREFGESEVRTFAEILRAISEG